MSTRSEPRLTRAKLTRFAKHYLTERQTMDKETIYDILAAVAVGLMLAFFLTVRG
jgi:hypothetical protein